MLHYPPQNLISAPCCLHYINDKCLEIILGLKLYKLCIYKRFSKGKMCGKMLRLKRNSTKKATNFSCPV